jgi:membrane-associated phospholipid phosphatase
MPGSYDRSEVVGTRSLSRASAATMVVLSLTAGSARADSIENAGSVGAILLPVGAAVGALVVKDHQGLKQLALAYGTSMAVVYVLKPLVDRTRPDGGSQSFPSGHSASAFAGAAFLQRRYGWKLGIPAYAIASFVGYSRVEAKRHYTSDVIAGGAIGIGANLIFTHHREQISVGFDTSPHRAGPLVSVTW